MPRVERGQSAVVGFSVGTGGRSRVLGRSGGQAGAGMNRIGQTALVLIGIVALWWGLVALFQPPGYLFPGPQAVWQSMAGQWAYLLHHAGITLAEMVIGLFAGAILGTITASLMALYRPAHTVLYPVLMASQALPVFAIAPLLVIWLGFGLASKIAMATLIIYFPVASAFHDGLRRTDRALLDLARLHRASRWQTFHLVQLPAALPALGSGLRVAAAIAPIGAVVGEWVGASAGIGFVMLQANARMQTDTVFASLVLLGLSAVVLRLSVDALTRRMTPWVREDFH
jgi:putative hydroxymethylpyrimidine transport system permease protein